MTNKSLNKVSIRLESGGHAFSPSALNAALERVASSKGDGTSKSGGVMNGADVEFVIHTHKTALVPAEYFDSENPRLELSAVGIAPASDEVVVCSGVVRDTVAVMAMNCACYDHISKTYGTRASFLSPLQEGEPMDRGVAIALYADVLYVRVYDGGMRFAEAMEVATDADVLYYLDSINRVYDIYNMHARATGDTQRLQKICRRMFKTIETL